MVFFKKKIIIFFERITIIFFETIDIKRTADKFYMHTYLTSTLFMFLTLLESLSVVKVVVQKREIWLYCVSI